MADEPRAEGAGRGPWPVLDLHERRVLGVLVEKAKTTPDAYPMSVNALVTGSNQKSNREPPLNLSDFEVEDALTRCKDKGLAVKITGGRVVRWRHYLYETWHVDKLDLAVLCELLLRGPQTEGELRTRAGRMEPFDELDALRRTLKPLAERGLVVYLSPEDRRGAVLTHGFHDPQELSHLRARHSSEAVAAAPVPAPGSATAAAPAPPPRAEPTAPPVQEKIDEATRELSALKQSVAELRADLTGLRDELRALKQSLGA